jgi:voltage-gated potassium channel Kch
MLKLIKRESRKLGRAFLHPTFLYLIVVGNIILITATLLVHHLEKDVNPHMKSYMDSLWWGVSTITTVGFGDIVPVTFAGRVIGIVLMYIGTVLFITFTGLLVTWWMRGEVEKELVPIEKEVRKEEKEQVQIEKILQEIRDRLERLENKSK